ncbi:MAG: class I SAM-dependent methyltransferase [Candidatus Bathyarchaeota archaeon]|nr:class I SAM-dependent methyltransferase [Candidatus Bathyarchaeota archaeon]
MTEWKQKRRHMCHYNRTAHIYDIRYTEEQNLKIKIAVESLKLGEQGSILDLGCGTGLLLPRIQEIAKSVVGLDVSKEMLKETASRIEQSANVHLILADADHTPLRNSYFDTIFAITLLQNMPNPSKTLQEAKRITEPNGSIIVTGLKKHFTEHSFVRFLKNAKLKTRLLKANDNLKCYIAICKNRK